MKNETDYPRIRLPSHMLGEVEMLSMWAVVGPFVSSPKRLRIFKILYPTNTSYRIHPRSTTPFHVIPDGRRNLGGEGRMSRKVGRRGEKNSDSSSASRPRRAGREKERKRERESDEEVGDIVAGLL